MVHINFIIGILVYSVAVITMLMLGLLWKKNRDTGIFWTMILIGSFTLLLVILLLANYLVTTGLSQRLPYWVLYAIDLTLDFVSLSMIFIVPRFSTAMAGFKDWKKGIIIPFIILLVLMAAVHLLNYSFHPGQYTWSDRMIYLTLTGSLAVTLSLVVLLSLRRRSEKNTHIWYRDVALKMARTGLIFIPLFCLFDFLPIRTPWEGLNRLFNYFSAVPFFLLIWNLRLIHGALTQNALLQTQATMGEQELQTWMVSMELTPREQEVAFLLIEGKSYGEICDLLCLSKATIKSHTNRIYRKTGISNQIGLIKAAGH